MPTMLISHYKWIHKLKTMNIYELAYFFIAPNAIFIFLGCGICNKT